MNKNTTTSITEYLSAFLDDEAGAFEQRRMLDEVQKDKDLQQKVAHFSLIGEAMRNEQASVTVQPNFLMGIHEQLEAEPEYGQVHLKEAANEPVSRNWLRPVTGMALAASLAAVAVVGINMKQSQNTPSFDATTMALVAEQPTETAKATMHPIVVASNKATQFEAIDAKWRNRLKGYVNNHAKYASTSAIMPSVRAASYAANF